MSNKGPFALNVHFFLCEHHYLSLKWYIVSYAWGWLGSFRMIECTFFFYIA